MRRIQTIFSIFMATSIMLMAQNAQNEKNYTLGGYVSDMQSLVASNEYLEASVSSLAVRQPQLTNILLQQLPDNNYWIKSNTLQQRLNYNWYPNEHLSFSAQLRTLLNWGDNVLLNPLLPDKSGSWHTDARNLALQYNGWPNYSINTTFDRLWLQYTHNKFEATLGRQRINWGQTFAFNPNDIFNSYSFFEFDYPERPGADALRLQYYTGLVSSLEVAAKIDQNDTLTIGALWKFNIFNYDIQFLAGYYMQSDYVTGLGWSGYINNFSLRGEASYFRPKKHIYDTNSVLLVSIGTDYSFSNSLFIQCEALYNQLPEQRSSNLFELYGNTLNSKILSVTEYTILLNASYPITPLINGNLSAIYYPKLNGFFLAPGVDISLKDNIDLSLALQAFNVELNNSTSQAYFGFIRIKSNF